MMKPNKFILNSDYLSLAQTGSTELTAYFAAETFPAGYTYIRTRDFTVSPSQGAIDQFLLSLNGADYVLGASLLVTANSPFLEFLVMRTSPNTIQVQLHEHTSLTGGYSMPAQILKVKVASFKPPNLF